ncbi:MAG TPA: hypothetical protein VE863_00900, partial [Pyrinomonadaceae bacterium]|nr:hypothetical protein [Pyrinomonadaceae bacterium]
MSLVTDQLGPRATNLAELIGLLNSDGKVNLEWFSSAGSELAGIPERLPQLFNFIQQMLGPAATDGPPVFDEAQWYPLPNPRSGTQTGLYLVASKPDDNALTGAAGIGVLHELDYG